MWQPWLLLLLLATGACEARPYAAWVRHVTDGDSLWVQPARGPARALRLKDIDAPEICQAGGPEARAALAALVLNRQVTVQPLGRDDYRRTLARVQVGGDDIGAWMVAHGHAWVHRYRGQARRYEPLEQQARRNRSGLWADPRAMDPRAFRRLHGSCHG